MTFKLASAYVEFSQRGLSSVMGMVGSLGSKFKGLLNPINAVTGALGALGVGLGVGSMLKLAARAETLGVAFEVLLGSAEKAKGMMEEINKFAAATPYEQDELAGVAKQLLAFGTAQDQIIPTMRQLGDIASLTGAQLSELAQMYGKVRQTGKLQMEQLVQWAERGVPVVEHRAGADPSCRPTTSPVASST